MNTHLSNHSFLPRFKSRLVLALVGVVGCGTTLPEDVQDVASRCVRLNPNPIPPTRDDPHSGFKVVYACNVEESFLKEGTLPYPEGTVIVKESTKEDEDAPWLVATARKGPGQGASSWQWDEYTRNFEDEDFRRILAGQGVCIDCHKGVESLDYIFTRYQEP